MSRDYPRLRMKESKLRMCSISSIGKPIDIFAGRDIINAFYDPFGCPSSHKTRGIHISTSCTGMDAFLISTVLL